MNQILHWLNSKRRFLFLGLAVFTFSNSIAQTIHPDAPLLVCPGTSYTYKAQFETRCRDVVWTCTNCSIDDPLADVINVTWSAPGE